LSERRVSPYGLPRIESVSPAEKQDRLPQHLESSDLLHPNLILIESSVELHLKAVTTPIRSGPVKCAPRPAAWRRRPEPSRLRRVARTANRRAARRIKPY
jgi:hypothetical protein